MVLQADGTWRSLCSVLLGALVSTVLGQPSNSIVFVNFQQSAYAVNESGGLLTVQLVAPELSRVALSGQVNVTCTTSPPDPVRFGDLSAAELITSSDPFGDYILHFDQSLLEDQFAVTFTNGSSVSSAFDIRIVGDNLREGMEFFQIEIINITVEGQLPGVELQPGPNSVVLVSIVDDDVLQVKFKEGSVSVNEGDSVVIHGQTSGAPFSSPIDIGVICFPLRAQGTKSATFGLDYNYTSLLQLEFSDVGQTAVMSSSGPTILALEDGCVEGMESFICAMQVGVSPGDTIRSMNPDTVTVKIIDEDQLMIQWQRPNDRVLESAGVVVVQLMAVGKFQLSFTLLGTARQAVSSVVGGRSFKLAIPSTGSFTGDYRDLDATFSYSSSCTDMMISVSSVFFIEDDDVLEEDEVFELIFTIPTLLSQQINIKSGDTVNMSIIIEDDDYVSVGFGNTSCIGSEALGVASFNIEVTGKYYIDFQVEVECRSGSALAGQDFVMFRKFLNVTRSSITTEPFAELLPNITTTPPFLVEILNDSLLEPDECFVCQILSTTHQRVLIGSKNTTNCCVTDEDIVTVQFSKAFVSVPESIGVMQFELELIGSTAVNITVEVATLNPLPPSLGQPATGGLDYRVTMSLLTFPPTRGRGSMTFSVQLIDDQIPEGAEYFSVRINSVMTTHPRVVIGNPSTGVGQILDDDDFVTIGLESPTYNVSEDAQKVDVCVSLSNSYFEPITVTLIPQVISGSPIDVASVADLDLSSVSVTLGPGTTRFCSPITIIDEPLVEYDEDFTVTLTYTNVQAGVSLSGQNQTTITILNDDRVKLSFQPSSQMTSEGNVVEVTVVASARASFDYSFTVFSVDGSAIATQDYERVNLTLTYTGGSPFLTYSFNISIYNDSVFEESEDFQLQLTINEVSAARGIEPGTPDVSMVIIDADAGLVVASSGVEVSFHPINYTVGEGDNVTIVIVTNVTVDVPITVSVTFGGGSASEPNDYISGEMFATVVIPAGERMATLVIMTITDNLLEGSENFFGILNTSGAPNVVIGNVSMAMVIIEDQTNVVVSFLSEQASVREGHPGALILLLEGGVQLGEGFTFFVNIVPRNGTATAPDDFSPAVIPVHFVGGSNAATFVVSAKVDSLVEGMEHFFLDIMIPLVASDLGVSVGSRPTATVTVDDGDGVKLSFQPSSQMTSEGNVVEVTVVASARASFDYSFTVFSVDGSAIATQDYERVNLTFTYTGGSPFLTYPFNISIYNDSVFEESEDFQLQLTINEVSAARGIEPGTPDVSMVIIDADAGLVVASSGVEVSFHPINYTVGEGDNVTIVIVTNVTVDVPITVSVTFGGGSASEPNDYISGGMFATVVIPAGERMATLVIMTIADNLLEGSENFFGILNTSGAPNVVIGNVSIAMVIIEDQTNVVVNFLSEQGSVREGHPGALILVLEGGVQLGEGFTFFVNVVPRNGTATAPDDFSPAVIPVHFVGGSNAATFVVSAKVDSLVEGREHFFLDIMIPLVASDLGVSVGSRPTATVTVDDGDATTVVFSSDDFSVGEGDGQICVGINASLPNTRAYTLHLEVNSGTALNGADFGPVISPMLVEVAALEVDARVCVPILVDAVLEGEEYFTITLVVPSEAAGAGVSRGTPHIATIRVLDDDGIKVSLSTDKVDMMEGTDRTISVDVDGEFDVPFTITLIAVPISAGPSDYGDSFPLTITFNPGNTSVEVLLSSVSDGIIECEERYIVMLNTTPTISALGVSLGDFPQTEVIIEDNDRPLEVIFQPLEYTVIEGRIVNITMVTSTSVYSFPFSVSLMFMDMTASGGSDYVPQPVTVAFSPGQEEVSFEVMTVNDTIAEQEESFKVVIAGVDEVSGCTDRVVMGTDSQAAITISDSNVLAVRLTPLLSQTTEGSIVTVTIETTHPYESEFHVFLDILNGSALMNIDFTTMDELSLSFLPSPNMIFSHVVEFSITTDRVVEGEEFFQLILRAPPGQTGVAISSDVAMVTITDQTAIELIVSEEAVDEGDIAEITVSLPRGVVIATSFNITVSTRDGSATAPMDYVPMTNVVHTFPSGTSSITIPIPTIVDGILEPVESFEVIITVSPPSGAMATSENFTTIVDIFNVDRFSFSFAEPTCTVNERDQRVSITVVTNMMSVSEFQFSISISNGTAQIDEDYSLNLTPVGGGRDTFSGTFPAGVNSYSFEMEVVDDSVFEGVECVTLQLSVENSVALSTGLVLGNPLTKVACINDDEPIELIVSEEAVDEGDIAEITVSLPRGVVITTSFNITVSTRDGSATAPMDYVPMTNVVHTFPDGTSSITIPIPTIVDGILEPVESFEVIITVSPPSGVMATSENFTTTVDIFNVDRFSFSFAEPTCTVNERDQRVSITVVTNMMSVSEFQFSISISNGTAQIDEDYSLNLTPVGGGRDTFSGTFPAGVNSYSFEMEVVDDSVFEGVECVTLQLSVENSVALSTGLVLGNPLTKVACINDDEPIELIVSEEAVDEGDIAEITVSLPRGVVIATSFNITVSTRDGSATAPMDYVPMTNVVHTFPSGTSSITIPIPTIVDGILEPVESFEVIITVSPPSGVMATSENFTTAVDIFNVDRFSFSFAEPTCTVNERDQRVSITVVTNITSVSEFQFSISISNGTAQIDEDYSLNLTPVGGGRDTFSGTFPAGVNSYSFEMEVVDDSVFEGVECVTLQLSVENSVALSTGLVLGNPLTKVACINDDEPMVMLMFEDPVMTVPEGKGYVETCLLKTVNGSVANSTHPITVMIMPQERDTDAGSGLAATAEDSGVDFDENSGPELIIFAPNDTRVCFNITITDDNITEPDEEFEIVLIFPPDQLGVTLGEVKLPQMGPIPGIVIIEDDDVVKVSFLQPTYVVMETEGVLMVTLVADGVSSIDYDVIVMATELTATATMDFLFQETTVTFQSGETMKMVSVVIANDVLVELNETFQLELSVVGSDPEQVCEGDVATTVITIIDNTVAQVNFIPVMYTTKEGDAVVVTVVASTPSTRDYTVTIKSTDVTAEASNDYTSGPFTVTIPAGQTAVNLTIATITDGVIEMTEQFNLMIMDTSDPSVVVGPDAIAMVTIEDTDVALVNFKPTIYMTTEGGVVMVIAMVDKDIEKETMVTVRIVNGTAMEGADFTVGTATLVFTPGSRTAALNITALNDILSEGVEEFSVVLESSSDPRVMIGNDDTAVISISDSDGEGLTVSFTGTIFCASESDGFVEVTLETSRTHAINFIVSIGITPINATVFVDYNALSMEVVFQPGETSKSFQIPILDDSLLEGREVAQLTLFVSKLAVSKGVLPRAPQMALLCIEDDDGPVISFKEPSYQTSEGGTVAIGLQLNREFTETVEVVIRTMNSSATAGEDFNGGTFTVPFPSGTTMVTRLFAIHEDLLEEGIEQFKVVIVDSSDGSYLVGSPGTAVVNITDTTNLLRVQFEKDHYNISEGEDVEVSLVITGGTTSSSFDVILTALDGTATVARDYVGASFTVPFLAGIVRSHQSIRIVQDNATEGRESFSLVLNITREGTQLGVVPGDIVMTTIWIIDSDDPLQVLLSYSFQNYTIKENEGPLVVNITSSQPRPFPYNITITPRSDTAVANEDFDPTPITITINPGETMASFTVGIADDNIVEPGEVFHLDITISGETSQALVRTSVAIMDDDSPRFVNDTIIGDPLFTVPLPHNQGEFPELEGVSLCMEFRGFAGQYYNLVSDECTTVNAHYTQGVANPQLHVIDEIGVKTEGEGGVCHEVRVQLENCQTFVDGTETIGAYRADGVTVMAVAGRNRTRITVPNCAPGKELVMWVMCDQIGVGGKVDGMLQFTLSRAVGLAPTSHGLVAQFWNIPIEYRKFAGRYGDDMVTTDDNVYAVTVSYPESSPRTFLAELSTVTWSGRYEPCLYAGNQLAGRSYEGRHFGSVIEGRHSDYKVESVFAHDFTFDKYLSQC